MSQVELNQNSLDRELLTRPLATEIGACVLEIR